MSASIDPSALIENLRNVTPDSWKNIPRCVTDTFKSLIALTLFHDSRIVGLTEFQTAQSDVNIVTEKHFTFVEGSLAKEVEELNGKLNKKFDENLKVANELHEKTETQANDITQQLKSQTEKLKKGIDDGEVQRGQLMKKISELEVKLFKQKQEAAEQLQSAVESTRKELSTAPGLFGEGEKSSSLAAYLVSLKTDLLDGMQGQSQELKTEITIEGSKAAQRVDFVAKALQETKDSVQQAHSSLQDLKRTISSLASPPPATQSVTAEELKKAVAASLSEAEKL